MTSLPLLCSFWWPARLKARPNPDHACCAIRLPAMSLSDSQNNSRRTAWAIPAVHTITLSTSPRKGCKLAHQYHPHRRKAYPAVTVRCLIHGSLARMTCTCHVPAPQAKKPAWQTKHKKAPSVLSLTATNRLLQYRPADDIRLRYSVCIPVDYGHARRP